MEPVWEARSSEFWKTEFGTAAAGKKSTSQHRKPLQGEIRNILLDYAQNAYISCAGLASRENIPLWDRMLWGLVILGSAVLTVIVLYDTYSEYDAQPLEIAVVTSNLDLGRFPFPSVSVCPRSKIRKSIALGIIMRWFSEKLSLVLITPWITKPSHELLSYCDFYFHSKNNLTSVNETDVLPALRLMQSLKNRHWITFDGPGKITDEAIKLFSNISWHWFMQEVLPPCHEIFQDCYWSSSAFDCCDFFTLQKSRGGFCYAFNSLTTFSNFRKCTSTGVDPNARDSLWYEQRPSTRDCELFRTSGVGPSSALEVYLKAQDPAQKLGNRTADLGFDLIVSSPKDFPEPDDGEHVAEAPGFITYAAVTYSETSVSRAVRRVALDKRGCYFEDDADTPLSASGYWYSENSCIQLFFMDFLTDKCGCSHYFSFSVPHASICDLKGHECLLQESVKLFKYNSTSCLPLCGGASYKTEFVTEPSIYDHTRNTSSAISVFYRDRRTAMKYRQQLRMDGYDQLVAYGGLLSLLLGLSFVSLAQPLFYLCQVAAALLPRLRLRRRQLCFKRRVGPLRAAAV